MVFCHPINPFYESDDEIPRQHSADTGGDSQLEVEQMLSAYLLQGFCLLERSCPACNTPLVVKQSEIPPTAASASRDLTLTKDSTSAPDISPVAGVPYCVRCHSHVVRHATDIDLLNSSDATRAKGSILFSESDTLDDSSKHRMADTIEQSAMDTTSGSFTKIQESSSDESYQLEEIEVKLAGTKDDVDEAEIKSEQGEVIKSDNGLHITSQLLESERNENQPLGTEPQSPKASSLFEASRQNKRQFDLEVSRSVNVEEIELLGYGEEVSLLAGEDIIQTEQNSHDDLDIEKTRSMEAIVEQSNHRDVQPPVVCLDCPIPDFRVRREIAIKVLAAKMVQGFSILSAQCAVCLMPQMQSPRGDDVECFVCRSIQKSYYKSLVVRAVESRCLKSDELRTNQAAEIDHSPAQVVSIENGDRLSCSSNTLSTAEHGSTIGTAKLESSELYYVPVNVVSRKNDDFENHPVVRFPASEQSPTEIAQKDDDRGSNISNASHAKEQESKLVNEKPTECDINHISESLAPLEFCDGASGASNALPAIEQGQTSESEELNELNTNAPAMEVGEIVAESVNLSKQDITGSVSIATAKNSEDHALKIEWVRKEMISRTQRGWKMLDRTCPKCIMPLLTNAASDCEICVLCEPKPDSSGAISHPTVFMPDDTALSVDALKGCVYGSANQPPSDSIQVDGLGLSADFQESFGVTAAVETHPRQFVTDDPMDHLRTKTEGSSSENPFVDLESHLEEVGAADDPSDIVVLKPEQAIVVDKQSDAELMADNPAEVSEDGPTLDLGTELIFEAKSNGIESPSGTLGATISKFSEICPSDANVLGDPSEANAKLLSASSPVKDVESSLDLISIEKPIDALDLTPKVFVSDENFFTPVVPLEDSLTDGPCNDVELPLTRQEPESATDDTVEPIFFPDCTATASSGVETSGEYFDAKEENEETQPIDAEEKYRELYVRDEKNDDFVTNESSNLVLPWIQSTRSTTTEFVKRSDPPASNTLRVTDIFSRFGRCMRPPPGSRFKSEKSPEGHRCRDVRSCSPIRSFSPESPTVLSGESEEYMNTAELNDASTPPSLVKYDETVNRAEIPLEMKDEVVLLLESPEILTALDNKAGIQNFENESLPLFDEERGIDSPVTLARKRASSPGNSVALLAQTVSAPYSAVASFENSSRSDNRSRSRTAEDSVSHGHETSEDLKSPSSIVIDCTNRDMDRHDDMNRANSPGLSEAPILVTYSSSASVLSHCSSRVSANSTTSALRNRKSSNSTHSKASSRMSVCSKKKELVSNEERQISQPRISPEKSIRSGKPGLPSYLPGNPERSETFLGSRPSQHPFPSPSTAFSKAIRGAKGIAQRDESSSLRHSEGSVEPLESVSDAKDGNVPLKEIELSQKLKGRGPRKERRHQVIALDDSMDFLESDTVDALLLRIENAKSQLQHAPDDSNDSMSQYRLRILVENLAQAAEQLQNMECQWDTHNE